MSRKEALAYTGLAVRPFNQLAGSGSLSPKPFGPNGEKRYLRE